MARIWSDARFRAEDEVGIEVSVRVGLKTRGGVEVRNVRRTRHGAFEGGVGRYSYGNGRV